MSEILTRRLNAAGYVVASVSAIPLGGRRNDAEKERFDVLVITLALKGNRPLHPDPIDLILYDPVRDADTIADALIAYLDSGAAPGTIALENTFVAGEG